MNGLSPKPVLVTGATGCIGSALVKHLSESGQHVRALVRNPERATALRGIENVEIFPGDLSRPESLRGCMRGCSRAYHCAAVLSGSYWAISRAINVFGTQALIDEAVHAGIEQFIYTSTIGVYGLTRAETITEKTPWAEFKLPYFTTKQEAERIVQKYMDRLPITIARLGDVFGPGQFTWTIDLIQKSRRGLLTPLLESQSGYLNPIYIDNLIDALLLMGRHTAAIGQVFNVVDGFPIRASDFIRRMNQMTGMRLFALPVIVMRGAATLIMWGYLLRGREALIKPGEINYLQRKGKIDPEKLRSGLGWAPAVPQEEAFRRTQQWLRQEGYLPQTSSNSNFF